MSTTTGSEGGYTVPSEIAAVLIDSLKHYGAMLKVAESHPHRRRPAAQLPDLGRHGGDGEVIAQNITATAADPTFGTKSLNVFKFGSKIVAAPIELLQDSTIDIEAFIRKRLQQRLGRILNTKFTTGGAPPSPTASCRSRPPARPASSGQTVTVIYDDLVDVVDAVDIAYQGPNCKWMFNQSTRKVIRKIKDGQQPADLDAELRQAGIAGGFVDELLGFPVQINNDMANMGANNYPIIFGDFSTTRSASPWRCRSSASPTARTPSSARWASSRGCARAATW
jgi:HK97 family phage major capsid protein